MARRWTMRLSVAVVAAVLLSGCSEEQEASESLPPASSAAPGEDLPSLGPDSFPVPPDAREKTPEGALAFAEYYLQLGIEIGSGNAPPEALGQLSASCDLCQQVISSLKQDVAAGYRHVGGSMTFAEYALPRLDGDAAEVGFVYSQSAYKVVDADGQEVPSRSAPATGELQSGMFLEWRDDLRSWTVDSLTIG
ncbi:DUF6318 family protein [Blastococcus sp. CCUG 61487]|uniref:DUF6318 family protein n=1 Tax=Blastococcus sp. CCUG 61487 TaxID=1840703 RepID=UPI0010BFAA37|nr:DUF6318 family protein [Blastococcus sp. CCUG 61487]